MSDREIHNAKKIGKYFNETEKSFIEEINEFAGRRNQTWINNMEKEYPIIAKEFKNIIGKQYELFAKKMLSYGLENISMGTQLKTEEDKKLSLTSIWIRVNDKMNRLKNLVLKSKPNPLNDEPTEDAWKDMVNYGIIAQLVNKDLWIK